MPIWDQFLLSLAESFPDPIFRVTDKQGHLSWEEMPSKSSGQVRGPTIFSLIAWEDPFLEAMLCDWV